MDSSALAFWSARVVILGAAMCAPACSWEEDGPSSADFVGLRELEQGAQPTTENLGVLVVVTASGPAGAVVRLTSSGGTIDESDSVECLPLLDSSISAVVSVHPRSTEALLTATLGTLATETTPPQSNDAGTADAAAIRFDGATDGGGGGVGDAVDASTVPAPQAPTTSGAALPDLSLRCGDRVFVSLGKTAALVVSIGRAPVTPVPIVPDGSAPDGEPDADASIPVPDVIGDSTIGRDTEPAEGTMSPGTGDSEIDSGGDEP